MKNKHQNIKWIYNYAVAYKLLMVFTILWLCYIIHDYIIISQRPNVLYQPIWGFQKLFMPKLVSSWVFGGVVLISLFLSIYSFFKKHIVYSLLLFIAVLWLNAIRWNYGSISHVGHIFVLGHLFSVVIPNYYTYSKKLTIYDVYLVKVSLLGVLVTYSMAGFWKFVSLILTIYKGELSQVSWLHKDAVELNAIVGKRTLDNLVSEFMMEIYQLPYIWEVSTVLVFVVQLTAVLAILNRKYASIVMFVLVCFHLFNTFFNDIVFNVAPIILLILLFPYHLIFKSDFHKFKSKFI